MTEFTYYDPIVLAISGQSSTDEMHLHPQSQLSVPKNGVMYINVSNQLFIIPHGMAIFIPANTVHGVERIGHGREIESIYFNNDCQQQLPRLPTMLSLSALASAVVNKICNLHTDVANNNRVSQLLLVLIDEINDGAILNYSLPIPNEPRLIRLCQIFCKSKENYPTLKDSACELNVSTRTLERLFQHEFGMSFSLWKQKFMFIRAVELLQRYKRVSEVAYRLGYNSDSAFITMFKKMSGGITPTKFLSSKE